MASPGSAFQRRAALFNRRREGLRNRTARAAWSSAILLASDIVALLVTRVAAGWTAGMSTRSGAFGDLAAAGPLANPGQPASLVFWLCMVAALVTAGTYGPRRGSNLIARLAAACLLAAAITTAPLAAVVGFQRAIWEMTAMAAIALLVLAVTRSIAELFLRRVWPGDRWAALAVLVGPPDAKRSPIAVGVTGGGDYKVTFHHVEGDKPQVDSTTLAGHLGRAINATGAEALILTESLPDKYLRAVVEEGLSSGCHVVCPPHAVAMEGLRPRLVWHGGQPLLEFGSPVLQLSALATKRATDIIGAGALLVLVSPVMLLIALAVKLDSPGPVFFSQHRAGFGGKRFRMLKFRTMRAGADEEKGDLAHLNHTGDVRLFKIRGDPRVTRFGSFLRRWSLDELPQFWNVLRGDMSLVGPRPFFESDLEVYEDHHFRRLDTKPGITGLWQVGGRSDVVNFEDVVYLDRQYIEHWSFWLDLRILLRTIPSVIRRTGAY